MAGELTYNEPLIMPDTSLKTSSAGKISIVNNENTTSLLVIKPNPANNYTIAEWELPETAINPYLYINDIDGRFVEKIKVNSLQDEKVISLNDYKPGTYIISIISDGIKYDSSKLTIVK